jgi:riboflavin synthase
MWPTEAIQLPPHSSLFNNLNKRMFSGLVETQSEVVRVIKELDGIRLVIGRPEIFDDIRLGDSIAIQGCCLTVIAHDEKTLSFQAGEETLSKTTFNKLASDQPLNCERSLRLGDRLGGHLVSGHVDGVGHLIERRDHADWSDFTIQASPELMSQMASKGSITVDGVSLTLVNVTDQHFSVALIPHTLQVTTLGRLQPGDQVNLETDLLAKYVARQLAFLRAQS